MSLRRFPAADSYSQKLKSDEVLAIVHPRSERLGFSVEKGKKKENTVAVPVLYGLNGRIEKSFEADGCMPGIGYVGCT